MSALWKSQHCVSMMSHNSKSEWPARLLHFRLEDTYRFPPSFTINLHPIKYPHVSVAVWLYYLFIMNSYGMLNKWLIWVHSELVTQPQRHKDKEMWDLLLIYSYVFGNQLYDSIQSGWGYFTRSLIRENRLVTLNPLGHASFKKMWL